MSSVTFLRLELAGRESRLQPNDTILVNVDHIVRIHPTWPQGSTIVLSDDSSLNVTASLEDLEARLRKTGGSTSVFAVDVHPPQQVDEAYEAMRADLLP